MQNLISYTVYGFEDLEGRIYLLYNDKGYYKISSYNPTLEGTFTNNIDNYLLGNDEKKVIKEIKEYLEKPFLQPNINLNMLRNFGVKLELKKFVYTISVSSETIN